MNGSLSERFVLGKGTRQGCCRSPTLFAIYIELLVQVIRQDRELRGETVGDRKLRFGLIVDDVMIYLMDADNSFVRMMEIREM